jgi:hypothetical protein
VSWGEGKFIVVVTVGLVEPCDLAIEKVETLDGDYTHLDHNSE